MNKYFFKDFIFIYVSERQPVREGTQAEGVGEEEAGSQRRARCGTRSWNTGITP